MVRWISPAHVPTANVRPRGGSAARLTGQPNAMATVAGTGGARCQRSHHGAGMFITPPLNPSIPRNAALTSTIIAGCILPSRSAWRASIVAILQGRITEGAGRPASAYSAPSDKSPGHGRFSALVIMTTHKSASFSPIPPADTTSAGRCWRVAGNAKSRYRTGAFRFHLLQEGLSGFTAMSQARSLPFPLVGRGIPAAVRAVISG